MTQVTLKEKKTAVRLPRGAKAPARRVKSRARELGASVPAGDTDTDTDTGNAGAGAARVQRKKKKRAKNTNAVDPGSKHASAFPRTASVERQLSDAPAWNYANTYLLRGFRPASGCVKSSLLSIVGGGCFFFFFFLFSFFFFRGSHRIVSVFFFILFFLFLITNMNLTWNGLRPSPFSRLV
jgi:hypothetical protein